ncbi:MAG TPA: TraR/DksA family transcriptional regulator [Thermodesulfobacteriota bacterium]|nr:TraR/DksA family transcriptional regulator [Thermodesulfobacteriota bacterium]
MAKAKVKKPEKKNKKVQKKEKLKRVKQAKTKAPKTYPKKASDKKKKKGESSLKTQGKKRDVTEKAAKKPTAHKTDWKDEIRGMLTQMRKELLRDVSRTFKTESDHLKFDVGDFYDHASSDRDRELALMITDRERDKLVQIDEALRNIEDGSYGICESCGDEIDQDRLKAMPFAKLCLSCKIDLERQGNL